MAKALLGHLANDQLLTAQIVSLRARVRVLETELAELRAHSCVALPTEADLTILESELAELGRATPALA